MINKRVVIALGGNAIQTGEGTSVAQQHAIEDTVSELEKFVMNDVEVIISHGNGPQVGAMLIQQKESDSERTPAMPLDVCGAMSQGMIGYWFQNAVSKMLDHCHLERNVATILTRVEVDPNDEAFQNPTKPVGPFYTEEEAKNEMENNPGVTFKEDAGRGWRKVVASPHPINIIEAPIINDLVDHGNITISCGGGGVPVVRLEEGYRGVEAVIDKDFASEKLAELVNADILLILTAVDHVYINFNKPDQKMLERVTAAELEQYIKEGQFAKGSMLPKIEAALEFVNSGEDKKVIITDLKNAYRAFEGTAGTVITK